MRYMMALVTLGATLAVFAPTASHATTRSTARYLSDPSKRRVRLGWSISSLLQPRFNWRGPPYRNHGGSKCATRTLHPKRA